jgi:hypothetical protein
VTESESVTFGVPYSDNFTVVNRFCLLKCTANSTRLIITSHINYTQKTFFFAKSNKFLKLKLKN